MINSFGYTPEMSRLTQEAPVRINFALNSIALMLGIGNVIDDRDLQIRSQAVWSEEPRLFGSNAHRFLCEEAGDIDLGWWCSRAIVAHEVAVHFQDTTPEFITYCFSEDNSRFTPHRNLLITLQNPRDLVRSGWEATIKEYYPKGGILLQEDPLLLNSKTNPDDFRQLVTSIQTGLSGATFVRIPIYEV